MRDINGVPIYTMGYMTVPTLEDGLLYHYTTYHGLLSILKSMSLRMSPLSNLNDLSEGKIVLEDYQFQEDFEEYLGSCKILSFCRNYQNEVGIQEGTNRPRNWAHYANNCRGACIVIRSEDFLKENTDRLANLDYYTLEKVEYRPLLFSNHYYGHENSNVVEFIRDHHREIFFIKHSDWENEDESRLLCCGVPHGKDYYLSISTSIDSICLGERLLDDNKRMEKLITVLSNKRNPCWRHFGPHSFSSVSSSPDGYMTDGTIAASRLVALAKINKNRRIGLRIDDIDKKQT